VIHREIFEADPNLTYRYAWEKRNAYQQNVYGIVTAHGECEKSVDGGICFNLGKGDLDTMQSALTDGALIMRYYIEKMPAN